VNTWAKIGGVDCMIMMRDLIGVNSFVVIKQGNALKRYVVKVGVN
jgi:hypothetical protein